MTSSIKAKLNKLKNPVLSLKVPREHRHPHSLIDEENRKKREDTCSSYASTLRRA